MDYQAAEKSLLSFPGLPWKGARCVLSYSLEGVSFPLGINTFRIFKRIGVIGLRAVCSRKRFHDKLQHVVEPECRNSFHLNPVVHGQRVCLAVRPRCDICIARDICKLRGLINGKDNQRAGLVPNYEFERAMQ